MMAHAFYLSTGRGGTDDSRQISISFDNCLAFKDILRPAGATELHPVSKYKKQNKETTYRLLNAIYSHF